MSSKKRSSAPHSRAKSIFCSSIGFLERNAQLAGLVEHAERYGLLWRWLQNREPFVDAAIAVTNFATVELDATRCRSVERKGAGGDSSLRTSRSTDRFKAPKMRPDPFSA